MSTYKMLTGKKKRAIHTNVCECAHELTHPPTPYKICSWWPR